MDQVNPYSAPNGSATPLVCAADPPTNMPMALRRGAWLGWKWGNYVAAGHVVFFMLYGAGLAVWMHAAGKRIRVPTIEQTGFVILIAMAGYVDFCVYGIVIGAYVAARKYYRSRRRAGPTATLAEKNRRGKPPRPSHESDGRFYSGPPTAPS